MDILHLPIPPSLMLIGLLAWVLLWPVKNGQFDDLEGRCTA